MQIDSLTHKSLDDFPLRNGINQEQQAELEMMDEELAELEREEARQEFERQKKIKLDRIIELRKKVQERRNVRQGSSNAQESTIPVCNDSNQVGTAGNVLEISSQNSSPKSKRVCLGAQIKVEVPSPKSNSLMINQTTTITNTNNGSLDENTIQVSSAENTDHQKQKNTDNLPD